MDSNMICGPKSLGGSLPASTPGITVDSPDHDSCAVTKHRLTSRILGVGEEPFLGLVALPLGEHLGPDHSPCPSLLPTLI